MSVLVSDVVFYSAANMPSADGTTAGGSVNFSSKITFVDVSPTGTLNYVSSSSSDTGVTITMTGRDSTGAQQIETKTLTGTTVVAGTQSFERLLQGVAGGTTAVGDVAALASTAVVASHTAQGAANATSSVAAYIQLAAGDGATIAVGDIIQIQNNLPAGVQYQLRQVVAILGDFAYVSRNWSTIPSASTTYSVFQGMLFDLAPNQVKTISRFMWNAASDVPGGSTRNYYAKVFAVNNNTTTALTSAQLSLTDPSGDISFGLTAGLNDNGTVINRQTAPAGITFGTSAVTVPSPSNLPPGTAPNAAGAQGVWLKMTLPAGAAAQKITDTLSISGNSV